MMLAEPQTTQTHSTKW